MRAVLAALLAAVLVALASAPHVHAGPLGAHECAACLTRGIEPVDPAPPVLAPPRLLEEAIVLRPVQAPPAGAPLGAIPGQSPPANG